MLNCECQNPISRARIYHLSSLVPKPSEVKSYRKIVKRWLLFTRTPAQLQGPRVFSRLTGRSWDACDGPEPENVATDDGVNVILETLADAFRGEHETELFDALEDTFNGPGRKKGEQVHDNAPRRAGQTRSTSARPSARIHSTWLGKPEHSSPHCLCDTGGQQPVFCRCEEGVQALRRRVFVRPEGARCAQVACSLCVTGKRSQGCNRGTGRRY